MAVYGTILCAIDFSETSGDALRLGMHLASRLGAGVVAVHVIDRLLAEAAATRDTERRFAEQTAQDLQAFVVGADTAAADGRRRTGSAAPACIVRTGTAHEEILACANEQGAGLVVMGTHGLGGLKKLFFGSVTEKVLRDTPLPVLAVTKRDGDAPARTEIGGVMAAIELDANAEGVLAHASALASALTVPLSVFHVARDVQALPPLADAAQRVAVDRQAAARARLKELVGTTGREGLEAEVEAGPPAEQIARAASSRRDAIVVIGLGGRGVFHPPGSTAYRVLCMSAAPVLAVPGVESAAR